MRRLRVGDYPYYIYREGLVKKKNLWTITNTLVIRQLTTNHSLFHGIYRKDSILDSQNLTKTIVTHH